MTIDETILAIQKGTITVEQIPEARNLLHNEISACEDVLQDPETEVYGRNEYRAKLTLYKKNLNRI